MAIDFSALLYGPVHTAFAVDVTVTTDDGATLTLPALDKSVPFETADNGLTIETMRPACVVRVAELTALGTNADALINAELSMNGSQWRVEGVQPRPSPNGEADGEVWLTLLKVDE